MKKLTVLAASIALAAIGSANAAVITIDDFNSPDVVLTGAGNLASSHSDATRTLTLGNLSGPNNLVQSTLVGFGNGATGGVLTVANTDSRDATIGLEWTIGALALPADAFNVGFFMQIVASDGNPTSLDFSFNGNPLASFSIAPNTINKGVSFGLSAAELAAVSAGGTLALAINGAVGWDLSVDQFGFSYDVRQNQVPEPGSLALVGLALVGIGFGARHRKA